jgi:ubiquitin C-terminal hydrolase
VGAICHFNSLLQGLSSCPAVIRVARSEADRVHLEKTATGRALRAFFAAAPHPPADGSIEVLRALLGDLKVRHPHAVFGPGQQSASEGLTYLLDMTDVEEGVPTLEEARATARTTLGLPEKNQTVEDAARNIVGAARSRCAQANPLAYLFRSRYQVNTHCVACGAMSSVGIPETAMMLGAQDWPEPKGEGCTSAEFGNLVKRYAHSVDGYRCGSCGKTGTAGRTHILKRAAEIVVVRRNVYGHRTVPEDFPATFEFPSRTPGGRIPYRRMAVVDHSGSLSGGHYRARALRRFVMPKSAEGHGRTALGPYSIDDGAVTPLRTSTASADGLTLDPGTYLVFYHAT